MVSYERSDPSNNDSRLGEDHGTRQCKRTGRKSWVIEYKKCTRNCASGQLLHALYREWEAIRSHLFQFKLGRNQKDVHEYIQDVLLSD